MKLADKTSLGYILTIIYGLYLMLFSLFSFIFLNDYLTKGTSDFNYYHIPCGPGFMIAFIIIIWILNVYNSFVVYKKTKINMILNILYILIIYPLIILIFILAGFLESVQIILVAAFPVFFIGAFLLPTCAYIIYTETLDKIEKKISQIECFNCRYEFEIDPQDKEKECPLCGALNIIPFK
ncbi:MAG: hypothetical protein JSV56_00100 [Methanomassiliicoccales archaeon]|nr:MAG: hypothetical protein JSV56_00100 [Methanomassiliicoccales archaeon]